MLLGLYAFMLILAVAVSSIVTLGPGGVFVFGLVFLLAALLNQWRSVVNAILCFLLLLLLIAFLLPMISVAREAAFRAMCVNDMKQLALALHNYHERYHSLPPPYIPNTDGKPMHSWRVLILPFLERQDLYDEYDFNEPWDGPHNKEVVTKFLPIFRCPSGFRSVPYDASLTNYVAVVGPNAAWRPGAPRRFEDADLRGKAATTVLLVEITDSDIKWAEPRDLIVDELGQSPRLAIGSGHSIDNGFFYESTPAANVVMADGHVEILPIGALKADELNRVLAIGGLVKLEIPPPKIHWPHLIGLAVLITSTVLLLHLAVWSRRFRNASTRETTIAGGQPPPGNEDVL